MAIRPNAVNPVVLEAQLYGIRVKLRSLQEAQEALREEEQRLQKLLETSENTAVVTLGASPPGFEVTAEGKKPKQVRKFSAEARRRIREAQKKRWALQKQRAHSALGDDPSASGAENKDNKT